MTQAQLIAAMLATAAPVTKHYWTDLGHDAKLIANAEYGDSFLWAPVECGSRIIALWRGDKPNKLAESLDNAMRESGAPNQWYRVTIGQYGEDCTLQPLDSDAAAADAKGATRAAQATPCVEEMNL